MIFIRKFSIGSVTFDGLSSCNDVTVIGRSMLPAEMLERLDDDVQVQLVTGDGCESFANLAYFPMQHGDKTCDVLCAVADCFNEESPAVIAACDWKQLVGADAPILQELFSD